jgi:hypothetical protein
MINTNILIDIQNELKAPKGQFNNFGKYKYRSCEDILEALKPVLKKYETSLTITDDIKLIGNRYYIQATCKLWKEGKVIAKSSAFAREPEDKKGMDSSQVTGTASSYARKYALNGLFLIDDTKDADTDEHYNQTSQSKQVKKVVLTQGYKKNIEDKLAGMEDIAEIKKSEDSVLESKEWSQDQEDQIRYIFQQRIDVIEANKPIDDEIKY